MALLIVPIPNKMILGALFQIVIKRYVIKCVQTVFYSEF